MTQHAASCHRVMNDTAPSKTNVSLQILVSIDVDLDILYRHIYHESNSARPETPFSEAAGQPTRDKRGTQRALSDTFTFII